MKMIKKIRRFAGNLDISAKITATYTACFTALLILINVVMWLGIAYALYTPAERSLNFSIKNVRELLEKLETDYDSFNPDSIREPLLPGVVLRVSDSAGNVFIDTDPRYPSQEKFENGILKDKPFFASDEMKVAVVGNGLVYRAVMDYVHAGENFKIYFYRTITSERSLLDNLMRFLLFLDIVGFFVSIGAGYLVSRRILNPIKTMTELARGIAFGKMDGRIPIRPTKDELTELAKTLNSMLDRLQGGISKQQKFVSDASHELRTPTTVISGYTELLEKYGAEDKEILAESIEAIRSESQNMQSLLENLLFLARADRHSQKLNKVKFNLAEIVGDVMTKMKVAIKTHEIELLQNDDAEIFGDKVTIRQMMRIFLDNATKYTPPGGKISVSSVRSGRTINLTIADTGVGIAPENRERIFERFFRVSGEQIVDDVNGSGLGLSIAKWIADNHDTKIEIDGAPGEGTAFTLKIPVAD